MKLHQDKMTPSIEEQVKAVLLTKRMKELDAKLSILELMDKFGTKTVLAAIEEICDDKRRSHG